jgi:hypothetical protein
VPLRTEKAADHERDERERIEQCPHPHIGHVLDTADGKGAK